MHYTLFELERIEKILQAKLYAARGAYAEAEEEARKDFSRKVHEMPPADKEALLADYGMMNKAWEEFRGGHVNLKFLHEEVELFKEGVESLQSYWNHSTEIFIENMRKRISEKEKA